MIDSTFDSNFNFVLFTGLDSMGTDIVLFTFISNARSVPTLANMIHMYLEAGFVPPKLVI